MNSCCCRRSLVARSVLLALLLGGGVTSLAADRAGGDVPAVDLGRVADGVHRGSAEVRGFMYEVETTVRDHRIVSIEVLKNKKSRYGRKAVGVIPLILAQQKAGVDGVSGATHCSTGLKRAVANSLQGEP